MNIYVTEQGVSIKKNGGQLCVEKSGEQLLTCPIKEVEAVVLFGSIQVSTQAMLALLEEGCNVNFLTQSGHFRGLVRPAHDKNAPLRMKQYKYSLDEDFCLSISRRIVCAKILNGVEVLRKYAYSTSNPVEPQNIKRIEGIAERAETAKSLDELRGYEGNAAKEYFADFGECFTEKGIFKSRKFYPAPDPINALLSFGYSFIAREMQSALESAGLDPYIGFFHKIQYGRASLSMDLIEPLRHIVIDRLVLKIMNKGIIGAEDFSMEADGGCYLKKESLNKFIRAYEENADTKNVTYDEKPDFSFREILRSQAIELKSSIDNSKDFSPYIYSRKCVVQSATT